MAFFAYPSSFEEAKSVLRKSQKKKGETSSSDSEESFGGDKVSDGESSSEDLNHEETNCLKKLNIQNKFPLLTEKMPIFIVSNPYSPFRRKNMERRVRNFGLEDRTTFIPGGKWDTPEVDEYVPAEDNSWPEWKRKRAGCLLGHLRAIRAFLDTLNSDGTVPERACILEDDVLFRNDFVTELETLPKTVPLIQLYTMSGDYQACNLYIYGAQGYIIRRDWAEKVNSLFYKPVTQWDKSKYPIATSEVIIMHSKGVVLSQNPLVIEDGLSYTIQGSIKPNHQEWQQVISYKYGLHKYINCDPEFKFDPAILSKIIESIYSLDSIDILKIMNRMGTPGLADQVEGIESNVKILQAGLMMLSQYYLDYSESLKWFIIFFDVASKREVFETIKTFKEFLDEVLISFKGIDIPKYSVSRSEKIDLDGPLNWCLLPNAPFILVD